MGSATPRPIWREALHLPRRLLFVDKVHRDFDRHLGSLAEPHEIDVYREIPDWILSLGSENLGAVDRLDIAMDYDMHSYAYHLVPKVPNQRLLIFQKGHNDDMLTGGGHETLKYFLDKGYAEVFSCIQGVSWQVEGTDGRVSSGTLCSLLAG